VLVRWKGKYVTMLDLYILHQECARLVRQHVVPAVAVARTRCGTATAGGGTRSSSSRRRCG
jgi:hypothetical protein